MKIDTDRANFRCRSCGERSRTRTTAETECCPNKPFGHGHDWSTLVKRADGESVVTPAQCRHGRDYRTMREDGTQDCECGAIIATDGITVYVPATCPECGHVLDAADHGSLYRRCPNTACGVIATLDYAEWTAV